MSTIVVSGIGFEGRHGATAHERRTTRRFEVDVEIDADLDGAGRTDRLADTIDYRDVADTVVTIGSGEPRRLLEALAARMLDALADRLPAANLRIEVRKLNPPGCPGNPVSAAVRVQKARERRDPAPH